MLRIALPNKGRLNLDCRELLGDAGLEVRASSERSLTASLGGEFEAIFVRDRLGALDAHAAITVGRITPVVGVHGGPGVLGVGVVTAPDEQSRTIAAK